MDFIEKMTLFGDSIFEKEENITHNKKPTNKRRMFLGSLDQPTLHLTSDDYSTFLDLKLGKILNSDLCFLAINRSNDSTNDIPLEQRGCPSNVFSIPDNKLKVISNKLDHLSLRFYYNLIILGRICEAICMAGISLESVDFNRDILNSFVNKSLEFYGYYDYDFDCNIIMNVLHSNTESYDNFVLNNIYSCGEEFNIGSRKGILGYTDRYVYLRMDKDNVITLTVALAVDIMNKVKEVSSSIKEALAWILISSKGYYVHEQGFTNSRQLLYECLSAIWTEEKSEITPYNFAQCFKQS